MKDKLKKPFKETDIEILISTMDKDSFDFLVPMFPFSHFSKFQILIINQTQSGQTISSNYSNVRVINSLEKGLSKSRNLALENAIGKILVIADDDIVYQDEFADKIIKAYNKSQEASVIIFCVEKSKGSLIKKYPSNYKKNLNIFDIFNASSIEMTLNKTILDKSNIQFDENFGLGGVFEMGEEAVFLFDLKKKNKQLVFEPEVIVKHENLTSTSKKSIIERYYIQGALFTRIFKSKYVFWIIIKLFFDLKQNKLRFKNLISVLKSAKQGHEKFEIIQNEDKK